MAGPLLERFRREITGSSPAASWLVAGDGKIIDEFHCGHSLLRPFKLKAGPRTLYDLASLTKPLATALIALRAGHLGLLDLEADVEGMSPPFSVLDLLRHEAGFPAWHPLYRLSSAEEARSFVLGGLPRKESGVEAVYSCPGYIAAGFILEERLGAGLGELFRRMVREPLGISGEEALFAPPVSWRRRTAGTELDGSFEREMALSESGVPPPPVPPGGLWGVAHDGNARFLGGTAGNSGLFATLEGTRKLLSAYLEGSLFLGREVLQLAFGKGRAGSGEHRSAGFKLPGSPGWLLGEALEKGMAAHEGFTGTFAAVSMDGDMMILLTNRIHPVHPRKPFSPERIAFARAAQEALNDA